ncbi:MAG: PcfB family protein [Lachnospiraceae bacterium]|nr:PcfB family protein [Lachnospiraceae bacterium]
MYQEDVENKACQLAVQTTKLTLKEVVKALEMYVRHVQNNKVSKQSGPKGKQTVKQLIGQGQGVSSIPVAETGLKDFQRVARKYGVDFAVVKDKSTIPTRYTIFFKAKDTDAITEVIKDYSAKQLQNEKKKSVREVLRKFKEKVASTPKKEKKKEIVR